VVEMTRCADFVAEVGCNRWVSFGQRPALIRRP
jgi:hypothetical protein